VRWQAERSEEFLSAYHGRDVASRAELALDADGRVLALRVSRSPTSAPTPRRPGSRSSC
jgi:CO/xanthine dehydrogenase Mo-binding subunit